MPGRQLGMMSCARLTDALPPGAGARRAAQLKHPAAAHASSSAAPKSSSSTSGGTGSTSTSTTTGGASTSTSTTTGSAGTSTSKSASGAGTGSQAAAEAIVPDPLDVHGRVEHHAPHPVWHGKSEKPGGIYALVRAWPGQWMREGGRTSPPAGGQVVATGSTTELLLLAAGALQSVKDASGVEQSLSKYAGACLPACLARMPRRGFAPLLPRSQLLGQPGRGQSSPAALQTGGTCPARAAWWVRMHLPAPQPACAAAPHHTH